MSNERKAKHKQEIDEVEFIWVVSRYKRKSKR